MFYYKKEMKTKDLKEQKLLDDWKSKRKIYNKNKTTTNLKKLSKSDKKYVDYINSVKTIKRARRSKSFLGRISNKLGFMKNSKYWYIDK